MVDIPAEVLWGQITGYFTQALADTSDVGTIPDAIPMSGSITITPSPNYIKFATTTPPQMITLRPVELVLENGYLKAPDAANPDEVFVLASSQPAGSPTNVVWRVSFNFEGLASNEQPADAIIDVPAGGVVNIVTAMPADPDPGISYVVFGAAAVVTQIEYAESNRVYISDTEPTPDLGESALWIETDGSDTPIGLWIVTGD